MTLSLFTFLGPKIEIYDRDLGVVLGEPHVEVGNTALPSASPMSLKGGRIPSQQRQAILRRRSIWFRPGNVD